MTISNGIGGAIYLNGDLYQGHMGNAGEIGHIIVEEDTDAVCGCGKRGCLEALCSGKGIEYAYQRLTGQKLGADKVADLARNGDEIALKGYTQAGNYIGKALSYSINLLNLKKIIIGGGVAQSFDLLEKPIYSSLEKYVFKTANPSYSIQKTGLGYYAALIGAAAVAQMKIK